jgi:hypothetical protein
MKLNVILFAVLVSATQVTGQETSQRKIPVVEIPREIGLITIAYQPECPLQFENAKFFAAVEGGGLTAYDLRNRGTKSVRTIAVGDSTGNKWTWGVSGKHGPVTPGQLIPPWSDEDWTETVPLTDELRKKLKLQPPMKGVLVLMVIRVEFTDGSVYDDEPVFSALTSYFQELGNKAQRSELNNKRRRYDKP